jgi:hypothetical protein
VSESLSDTTQTSKTQASLSLGVSRYVINYYIDTGKAEGVKGTYIFSRQLEDKEVGNHLEFTQTLN